MTAREEDAEPGVAARPDERRGLAAVERWGGQGLDGQRAQGGEEQLVRAHEGWARRLERERGQLGFAQRRVRSREGPPPLDERGAGDVPIEQPPQQRQPRGEGYSRGAMAEVLRDRPEPILGTPRARDHGLQQGELGVGRLGGVVEPADERLVGVAGPAVALLGARGHERAQGPAA
ncbi:MAG: hypothetical protein IPJ34_22465 [Myxococcales bacterium]|nr:hypothetical protein [Myxococcales bacterium]